MVLNIVTEQIQETRFSIQLSRSYLTNLYKRHFEKTKVGCKMQKMKMAALFGRKLNISASILLRKPCVGSKLGYSRSKNPFIKCMFSLNKNKHIQKKMSNINSTQFKYATSPWPYCFRRTSCSMGIQRSRSAEVSQCRWERSARSRKTLPR